MRKFIALAATAVVLAGCGCGSGTDAKDTAADGSDGFPRTMKTVMGDVKIPKKPVRVVTLDTGELDDVTMLGITPVGAVGPHLRRDGSLPDYLKAKTAGTKDVGPMDQPDLSAIAALKPDLILSSKIRHEKIYGKLNQIAPTVFTANTGGVWKQNLAVHAQALGREAQAKTALAAYEARAHKIGEEIKAKNGGKLPTASVVRFVDGPIRLYKEDTYSGVVLKDIGLPRPKAEQGTGFATEVGPEKIDQGDADLIFVTVYDASGKSQMASVRANPLWKSLKGVKAGKVFDVSDETWMSGIGLQAAALMLDDIAKATGVDPQH